MKRVLIVLLCDLIPTGIIPEHLIKTVCNGKKLDRGMIIKLTNYSLSNSAPLQASRSNSR